MTPYAVLEERARAVLPQAVFDYYAGGAGDHETLSANTRAWSAVRLRPHILRDVSRVDTATTVLGTRVAAPVLVAPTAFHRLAHPTGELATAEGTAAAGSLLVLSTRASTRIESVAAVAGPWWFQVYVLRDRALTRELVQRASAAGARALVLTGDTPYVGRKRRDRSSLAIPDEDFRVNLERLTDVSLAEQAPDVTFDDIGWLKEHSGLPVLVKGVLRADDAVRCVEAGAAGVVVSNHGGRQLDGAVASAEALPEVVQALAGRGEVLVDGGVRSGQDVMRALALGARAVLVGRPILWGLATEGATGVQRVLAELQEDTAHVMALAGASSVAEVTADLLAAPR
ncbi:alpha-hydroxy acid oxidase [Hyalangium versicolor]|uniref:alpha-hydroxy acid oxidase n=1 Tax=Hyalangium versicolor TaxID=2861190 RepID=UPI001CCFEB23|nr:alpha-hydroxy acid oxidase [Hyalangium versicolor]